MIKKRKLTKFAVVGTALTSAVFVLSIGVTSFASSANTSPKSATLTKAPAIKTGGTVLWAQPPSATPNYIFPFASFAFFSVANLTQFQYLMYRPLYWFGQVTTLQPDLRSNSSRWQPLRCTRTAARRSRST